MKMVVRTIYTSMNYGLMSKNRLKSKTFFELSTKNRKLKSKICPLEIIIFSLETKIQMNCIYFI